MTLKRLAGYTLRLTLRKGKVLALCLGCLLVPLAFAQATETTACRTKLHELGARTSDYPPMVLEVNWRALEPHLKSVNGSRAFELDEVNAEPKGEDRLWTFCLGDLLLVNADRRHLITVDMRGRRQLSEVKVIGAPIEAWRLTADLIAVNLYHPDFSTMALVFRLSEGRGGHKIVYYSRPARFGQTAIVLVEPGKGAVLGDYAWAMQEGYFNLRLFDISERGKGKMLATGCPAPELKALANMSHAYSLTPKGFVVEGQVDSGKTVSRHLTQCSALIRALLD